MMRNDSTHIQQELWLLRLRKGDEATLNENIAVWERPLFFYIRRLLQDEAESWDVLQEVWLRLFRYANRIQSGATFSAWLYRVARNQAITVLRKSKHRLDHDDEREMETIAGDEPSLSHYDVLDVYRALDSLSLAHREVITLHFLENFSVNEIAEITDTQAGTVKSRLHFAKRALRHLLDESASKPAEGERHA